MGQSFMKKDDKKSKPLVLIVAGGSAGHIRPALNVGEYLAGHNLAKVECVHGGKDLETQIYKHSSFFCHVLKVGRLRKSVPLFERLKTVFFMGYTLFKAGILIIKVKPHIVFGTGGAVSGPVLLMARLLGKKTVIWEPNVVPGFANTFLSRFVHHVITVLSASRRYFFCHPKKLVRLPYPLKYAVQPVPPKEGGFNIFILGGSQGSHLINKVICDFVAKHTRCYFFHQSGKKDFPHLQKKYKDYRHVELFSFKEDLSHYYQAAHLVIARAGMGALAELSYFGKPSLLVPLQKGSADLHQVQNARWMVEQGACVLIEEKDFTLQYLENKIRDIGQPHTLKSLAGKAKALNISGGAGEVADFLMSLHI